MPFLCRMKTKLFFSSFLFCMLYGSAAFAQSNVDSMRTLISLNLREADYPSAMANYEELIATDVKNESEYYYRKALCHYRAHQDSIGKLNFRKGLTAEKKYAGNHLGLGMYLVTSKPDSALWYFKKVEAALKDSLQSLQNKQSEQYSERRQILSDAFHNTGLIFLQKGKMDSAQYYLYKSMDLNATADEHFLAAAYFYYKINHFEKAYSFAKIALDMDRYESRSALLMGLALEKEGKLTKATLALKEHIVAQESALISWKRRDGSPKRELMTDAQLKGYQQIQELRAELYVVLAYLHYKKNERDLYAEAYRRAMKLNPELYKPLTTEGMTKTFFQDFVASKMKPPVAPKDYLPVYKNLFSAK